ncbi:TerD family protein [Streptomyces ochraceiscleroticus]|uniref:TerD family protein n=1 Tax=Streptomyces ochraceiscleroticus TaxID=47761 RepID=A0ABW1MJX3_9ACTN|nr:TerD family protein [Streptomyces ochraceiscleroticus]
MSRGQTIRLVRPDGRALTTVRIGFGWQAAPRRGLFGSRTREIDLDSSALLFADRCPVDVAFFRHLVSDDGSVRHTGDSLARLPEEADHEAVLVDLPRVPRHIDQIVFILNSFVGQTFDAVQSAYCRMVDETTSQELARFTLAHDKGWHTAQILAKVERDGGGWRMTAIGAPAQGRTFQDLMPAILPQL